MGFMRGAPTYALPSHLQALAITSHSAWPGLAGLLNAIGCCTHRAAAMARGRAAFLRLAALLLAGEAFHSRLQRLNWGLRPAVACSPSGSSGHRANTGALAAASSGNVHGTLCTARKPPPLAVTNSLSRTPACPRRTARGRCPDHHRQA